MLIDYDTYTLYIKQQGRYSQPMVRISNQQRSYATRAILLDAGRRAFHADGFAATSAESLVAAAGLTRGALYHHFDGKKGLFTEVVALLMAEIEVQTEIAADAAPDLWSGLIAGSHTWLKAATEPDMQRILLVDAPAVLGWAEFRALDARHGARSLQAGLDALAAAGLINVTSTTALTHALNGAFNELALWVAHADQRDVALNEALETLDVILTSIRR